jgi:hypothetical protein
MLLMKKKFYPILFFMLGLGAGFSVKGQTIISIAGITTEGYLGDSALASKCQLHWPEAVTLDDSGNVVIADADNNVIRSIRATTGIITTVAGSGFEAGTGTGGFGGDGGPASAARFSYPSGVACDLIGNMYIADQKNDRIRMVNATSGLISTIAGTGVPGFSGDGGPASSAKLNKPTRVYVDILMNLYIADAGNHCIRKVDASGNISTVAGTGGTLGFAGDGGPANAAKLNDPRDMTVDHSGNIYIADYENSRIRKVDASGNISTIGGTLYSGFSGDGGPATAAYIFQPTGIVSDSAGDIFFSDYNACIRKINAATGIISTFAGNVISGYNGDNKPSLSAQLNFPQGLAINSLGGIFVADKANNRIRYISTTLGVAPVEHAAALSIYPNPGDGMFHILIQSAFDERAKVTVTNMAGQQVAQILVATNKPADLAVVASPGVYFLTVMTTEGVQNQKVVVR